EGRSVWNRALGTIKSTTDLTQANQSSNSNVSTEIETSSSSNLLGLQSISGDTKNRDTNTNRPQLQRLLKKSTKSDKFAVFFINYLRKL
ncbi:MAG: hypothetical protein LBB39_01720, partial [Mycoplasmataceae bacterium]|nr:hypothetical protein [Mycoplasmataceae bacterium]